MRVETGDRVIIAGTIITGNTPKKLIFRGIGPSLAASGIAQPLADPVLELYGANGSLITSNDNWKDSQRADIEASGLAPSHDAESAIVATLAPNAYTALVRGKNGTSGVALVEIYDLDRAADSKLANISTRGFVDTGEGAMIGGFMLRGDIDTDVVLRALGPSLAQAGVSNTLSDPTLDVRNANGDSVGFSDDWAEDAEQAAALTTNGFAPADPRESASSLAMPAGDYTLVVRGKNGTTGVALVEIYNLQ